jgi:hypothetical protein
MRTNKCIGLVGRFELVLLIFKARDLKSLIAISNERVAGWRWKDWVLLVEILRIQKLEQRLGRRNLSSGLRQMLYPALRRVSEATQMVSQVDPSSPPAIEWLSGIITKATLFSQYFTN